MRKMILITTIIITSLLASVIFAAFTVVQSKSEPKQIYLKMSATKDSYILGEPIQLIGDYINDTDHDVLLYLGKTTVINVAKEGGDFKWFDVNPTDCSFSLRFLLKTNTTHSTLQNLGQKENGIFLLNAIGEAPHSYKVRTEKIEPNYAFQAIGTYYAKYEGGLVTDELKRASEPLRTEAVKITINNPTGDDLEVWKKIRGENKYKFAELMRSGGFYERDQLKKSSFFKEVEQLLLEYPNSTYSKYLRSGLDNFKLKEREELEKEKSKH